MSAAVGRCMHVVLHRHRHRQRLLQLRRTWLITEKQACKIHVLMTSTVRSHRGTFVFLSVPPHLCLILSVSVTSNVVFLYGVDAASRRQEILKGSALDGHTSVACRNNIEMNQLLPPPAHVVTLRAS